jgi:sugar phosphate isomerase/epimerase
MKISVSTSAFGGLANTAKGYIEACGRSKFRHMDFSLDNIFRNENESIEKAIAEVAEAASLNGVDFTMAHAPYKFNPCIDQETFDAQVNDMRKALDACGMLGIDRVTVHSGFGYSENREEMMEKNIRYYNTILPFAEKNNVMLMIENISEEIYRRPFVIETADNILELKSKLNDHPLIKACWDTGHANTKALDQYDNIKKLDGMLMGVHLQDNNGINDDHMPLLMGTVNYDEVIKGLLDIGYDGPFNMEVHLFNAGNAWPNYRRKFTEQSGAKALLFDPDDELKYMGLDLIYDVAAYILRKYGLEVE